MDIIKDLQRQINRKQGFENSNPNQAQAQQQQQEWGGEH